MSDDIWARMVPTHSGTPSVTLRRDIHIVRTKQELPVPSGRWETTLLPGAWLWLTRLPLRPREALLRCDSDHIQVRVDGKLLDPDKEVVLCSGSAVVVRTTDQAAVFCRAAGRDLDEDGRAPPTSLGWRFEHDAAVEHALGLLAAVSPWLDSLVASAPTCKLDTQVLIMREPELADEAMARAPATDGIEAAAVEGSGTQPASPPDASSRPPPCGGSDTSPPAKLAAHGSIVADEPQLKRARM